MNEDIKKISTFTATPFGELEQISPTISKCRLRIFYTGMTRNRTYITEDVANNLILTLPYTPIKGIVDIENNDFTDHGSNNDEGRIYGIVPSDPHFSWENHLDEDNVIRKYGCCDVYLFTALYPDSPTILGKPQSMELYPNTLQGEWKIAEDGLPYFIYSHCDFIGLQVLGSDVEPCFEGAAFYSLCNDTKKLVEYIQKYTTMKKEGKKEMPKEKRIGKFQISDDEKANLIFTALNPKAAEDGIADYWLCAVYDNYALVQNADGDFERIYYTKTEDGNSITIGESIPVKIIDATVEEETAIDSFRKMGNGDFTIAAKVAEDNVQALNTANSALESQKKEFETEKANYEKTISDLNSEAESIRAEFAKKEDEDEKKNKEDEKKENFAKADDEDKKDLEDKGKKEDSEDSKKKTENAQLAEYSKKIDELKAKNDELEAAIKAEKDSNKRLSDFKKKVEAEEKKNLINKFEKQLSEETINSFMTDIDKYSVEDLNKELSVAVFSAHPDLLSNSAKEADSDFIPKSNIVNKENLTPEERLIEQYKGGMK